MSRTAAATGGFTVLRGVIALYMKLRQTDAPLNSFSHHGPMRNGFQYTFGEKELLEVMKKGEAAAILHHGALGAFENNYAIVHRHTEALPVFASKDAGIASIDLPRLRAILAGSIDTWKPVGGTDITIEIGARQDGIFGKSLNSLLQSSKTSVPANCFSATSYEGLASYGAARTGALLLGLRSEPSQTPGLIELEVDGKKVSSAPGAYPLANSITLLVRKNDSEAKEIGFAFAESLKTQAAADGIGTKAAPLIDALERSLKGM